MKSSRIRILEDGALEIVDPRWDDVGLLREVDADFAIASTPLPGFTRPRFQAMRDLGCGLSNEELEQIETDALWQMHHVAIGDWGAGKALPRLKGEASMLALKAVLAKRVLQNCSLCARHCGVNRIAGERGICGLGEDAVVAESFVHIGEEPPINPSYVLSLGGCALRCRFCQQAALLNPSQVDGSLLRGSTWLTMNLKSARSLSFVGGNPDESLSAVLGFLCSAPAKWNLPIVWNSHAYSTTESMALLHGVVDVYLPDLKYSDSACGARWSKVEDYPGVARHTIKRMTEQNVLVIVRILLLPGHLQCCHFPALEFLASLPTPPQVSIRRQYCPDWQITDRDGMMANRITQKEADCALSFARSLGLALIGD